MFVYYFVQLDIPFEDVKRRLVDAQWMAPLATAAYHEGEAIIVSLGLNGTPAAEKDVQVELDKPIERDDVVVVPIRWRDTGPSRLFPILDGHIEASRLGSLTHVSILADYKSPGGYFGGLVDLMGIHHVAEAGVRSFLHRVADCLEGAEDNVAQAGSGHSR